MFFWFWVMYQIWLCKNKSLKIDKKEWKMVGSDSPFFMKNQLF